MCGTSCADTVLRDVACCRWCTTFRSSSSSSCSLLKTRGKSGRGESLVGLVPEGWEQVPGLLQRFAETARALRVSLLPVRELCWPGSRWSYCPGRIRRWWRGPNLKREMSKCLMIVWLQYLHMSGWGLGCSEPRQPADQFIPLKSWNLRIRNRSETGT